MYRITLKFMKVSCRLLGVIVLMMFLSGCVVKDVGRSIGHTGRSIGHTIKGDYYLKSKKTEQGRKSFQQEVAQNPDSAAAHYYYGRFLLQDNESKQALINLKKALDLDPGNAEYHFWTGIAYSGTGNVKGEEKSYRKALKIDKNHLQSLTYLGHSQLEKKRYQEALQLYSRVLEIWHGSPSALYNRALIMKKLGRTPEEKRAWLEYLSLYPSGAMARRATGHLNGLGDFSYRNHQLGARTVTIEKVRFDPFTSVLSNSSRESLNLVGSIMDNLQKGTLQIVTYQKNNKELAHKRAVAIKRYLLEEFSEIPHDRIGISWFAKPQTLAIKRKKLKIDESVSFFVTTD